LRFEPSGLPPLNRRRMKKLKYFTHAKIYNQSSKISSKKRNQNPSRYYYITVELISSFVFGTQQ
jgi:hypothetical protein